MMMQALSFLQGNYITLTNMKEHDLSRIIKYRLSPINISVQTTTNPELRVKDASQSFRRKDHGNAESSS